MNILAIDTTAKTASAAIVFHDGCKAPKSAKIIASSSQNGTMTHSETMLPMIEQMLKRTGMSISDIDLFALSAGPGSFTGVRIGVSLIKGLAFGSDKPCVGVSTLDALAYNLNGYDGLICPVMDARRSQFYTSLYKNGKKLMPDSCLPYEEIVQAIEQNGGSAILCGDGAAAFEKLAASESIKSAPELLIYQNAYSTAVCAVRKYQNNNEENFSASALSPVYLRLPQAERERLERMERKNDNGNK